MNILKTLPLLLAATIGLTGSTTITLSAHASTLPCVAGPPVCGGGGGNPGNPGNPGAGDPGPDAGTVSLDAILIACRISGDPEALPNDLKFRNIGLKVIPAGTRVYWDVKATNDKGFFVLSTDLKPDKELPDLDVLSAGTLPTNHCRPRIM